MWQWGVRRRRGAAPGPVLRWRAVSPALGARGAFAGDGDGCVPRGTGGDGRGEGGSAEGLSISWRARASLAQSCATLCSAQSCVSRRWPHLLESRHQCPASRGVLHDWPDQQQAGAWVTGWKKNPTKPDPKNTIPKRGSKPTSAVCICVAWGNIWSERWACSCRRCVWVPRRRWARAAPAPLLPSGAAAVSVIKINARRGRRFCCF